MQLEHQVASLEKNDDLIQTSALISVEKSQK